MTHVRRQASGCLTIEERVRARSAIFSPPSRSRSEWRGGGGTGQTTAEGADGSSACPGDSSHERGDAGVSGHPWDIQQADKSIRVRNAGEKLLPRPRFSPTLSRVGLSHCPCAVGFLERRTGCPQWLCGRPRKRLLCHAFRTPRLGRRTTTKTASPGANDIRGDDACLRTSVRLFDI